MLVLFKFNELIKLVIVNGGCRMKEKGTQQKIGRVCVFFEHLKDWCRIFQISEKKKKNVFTSLIFLT